MSAVLNMSVLWTENRQCQGKAINNLKKHAVVEEHKYMQYCEAYSKIVSAFVNLPIEIEVEINNILQHHTNILQHNNILQHTTSSLQLHAYSIRSHNTNLQS